MISIAMAAYNGEKYLREQLDSILRQTVQDFELVICDDCSTDGTVRILEEYMQKDSRIKVFVNKENLGFVKNFEKAILLCSGEYIALSDQDDVWTENHLQILAENIGDNDLVCGDALLISENGHQIIGKMSDTLCCDFIPYDRQTCFFFLLFNNFVQGSASMFSAALKNAIIPFPQTEGYYHDHWLALIASLKKGVYRLNEPVLYYRQHDGQVTKQPNFRNVIAEARKMNLCRLNALKSIVSSSLSDVTVRKEWEIGIKFYSNTVSFIGKLKNVIFYFKYYKQMYCLKSNKYKILRIVKSLFARGMI